MLDEDVLQERRDEQWSGVLFMVVFPEKKMKETATKHEGRSAYIHIFQFE